jgi:hypothetical protein
MYSAVKGIFENGQVFFEETPPTTQKTKVVVMFITEEPQKPRKTGVRLGSLAGERTPGSLKALGLLEGVKYSIPDDFNEPLDDLKDYM